MSARNGDVEELDQSEDSGIGVRALVGSGWGFFATPDVADAAVRAAGTQATTIARSSAMVATTAAGLVRVEPASGSWSAAARSTRSACRWRRRATCSPTATSTMVDHGADIAEGLYQVWDTAKWFVSAEGSASTSGSTSAAPGSWPPSSATARPRRRSYPAAHGQYGRRGWGSVDEIDVGGHAARVADEARALLAAPPCPSAETTLILGGEQLALQIHESVGHAIELDRILGWEAAYAGTSWLDLAQLGALRYGSELMTITIDPTIPGALGSFGYDDEGTPAAAPDAVRAGTWVGVLAGRDSAAVAGAAGRRWSPR